MVSNVVSNVFKSILAMSAVAVAILCVGVLTGAGSSHDHSKRALQSSRCDGWCNTFTCELDALSLIHI